MEKSGDFQRRKVGSEENLGVLSMSGAPRVRSMNVADAEVRPVLGPAGNKTGSIVARKPASKPLRKAEKAVEAAETAEEKKKKRAPPSAAVASSPPSCLSVPSVLRRQEQPLHSNLSFNGSCSSDASSDSTQSRASTGRIMRSSSARRRKQCVSKPEKAGSDTVSVSSQEGIQTKKRCAWVTPNTGTLLFCLGTLGNVTGTVEFYGGWIPMGGYFFLTLPLRYRYGRPRSDIDGFGSQGGVRMLFSIIGETLGQWISSVNDYPNNE